MIWVVAALIVLALALHALIEDIEVKCRADERELVDVLKTLEAFVRH